MDDMTKNLDASSADGTTSTAATSREGRTMGTLYLVPTPIGNLEDITYRAVRVLQEADLIAAEDTRHSGLLLKQLDIQKPLTSYHEHNKAVKGPQLIEKLSNGETIAVVSDAGMPAISDPGADLVTLAIEAGIPIVPLPGPNAALTALTAAGMDTTEFTFFGFLPKKSKNRKALLARAATYGGTLLFYEAPHRLEQTLQELYEGLGNRPITIARELTKRFETFVRTDLASVTADPSMLTIRGEFVLLVGGCQTAEASDDLVASMPTEETYVTTVQALMADGVPKKEAIRETAKRLGVARRDVYNAVEQALR